MATLSDIRTYVSMDLRDPSNVTFSTAEVDDLINQGIDALADVYPREIVSDFATIAASTYSYSAASFSRIYRIDLYNSAGTFRAELPSGIGEGANSGWELHGGVVYLPPSLTYTTGDVMRAFGYARYTQLSASTQTTDLDQSGMWAVRVFAQSEAYQRLLNDRAKYQQWQTQSNNTDVRLADLDRTSYNLQRRWQAEQRRLRRLRKS